MLTGSEARLRRAGADDATIGALSWCRTAVSLCLKAPIIDRPIISTSTALHAYLKFEMSSETRERVRILYLDARNALLADEEVSAGSINAAPVYNREILARSLELGATGIVVVHNHPSGDPVPSPEDIKVTQRLSKLCAGLHIHLVDHIIVGRRGVVSFRAVGLIRR